MTPGFGQFMDATPEYLRFAAQYGATDVLLNTPSLPGSGGRWELHDLVKLSLTVEQYGLKLSALENVPTSFYDHIMLGGPRGDEQIENMIFTVGNIARASIPYIRLQLDALARLAHYSGLDTVRSGRHRIRLRPSQEDALNPRP